MFSKKLLTSLAVTSVAMSGISQGAVALFIDDFKDDIGDSGEGDVIFREGANRQAFLVNDADPSDTATVAQTTPAGTMRTALATASTGGVVVGGYGTYQEGSGLGVLAISVNDGSPTDTADLTFSYDFAPVFDATAGGLLDTVEIFVGDTDWDATKGSFFIDFIEAGSGDVATWSFAPGTSFQVETALLSSLTGAGDVNFSNISDVTFRIEDAYDLDMALGGFGLSGPPVPEPSSALLAIIGGGFLVGRRRR